MVLVVRLVRFYLTDFRYRHVQNILKAVTTDFVDGENCVNDFLCVVIMIINAHNEWFLTKIVILFIIVVEINLFCK